jgi:hypothetical protein
MWPCWGGVDALTDEGTSDSVGLFGLHGSRFLVLPKPKPKPKTEVAENKNRSQNRKLKKPTFQFGSAQFSLVLDFR